MTASLGASSRHFRTGRRGVLSSPQRQDPRGCRSCQHRLGNDISAQPPKLVLATQGKVGSGEPDGLCHHAAIDEQQRGQPDAVDAVWLSCASWHGETLAGHVQRPAPSTKTRRRQPPSTTDLLLVVLQEHDCVCMNFI
jgi:hypothetical protein